MRPDFTNINITADAFAQPKAATAVPHGEDWLTPELIPVKPIYTKDDLQGMEHLDYVAGIPPFLRGPYSGHVRHASLDYPPVCRLLHRC